MLKDVGTSDQNQCQFLWPRKRKEMILKCSGDTFTFEFNEHDLVALTRNLMNRQVRGVVYHKQLRKVVGQINYYTMQFKLIDREAAGLTAIELGEETQVFLECN